jgi:dolichyl-phosphate-mannose--protein O-mannosyl transferase
VSDVDFQNEVSGYGLPGFAGDANDEWIVEIETGDKRDKHSWNRLRTLRTHFRLRHMMTGCYLFSHKVKLPDWGYEQQEVTCNKNAVRPNSLWYVETSTHPKCESITLFVHLSEIVDHLISALRMPRRLTTGCPASLANSSNFRKSCGQ